MTRTSREAARQRLGIEGSDGPVFLSAGFLQPSKGFDRAVEALAASRTNGARLYIVGSVREESPATQAYLLELRERCAGVPGATLVERYVGDEEFDLWLAAADWLVLPYRRSWSSGVLARAHALGTPAIVARVGGLPEQAGKNDVVFDDDDELTQALEAAAEAASAAHGLASSWFFLVGGRGQLSPVWAAYGIGVQAGSATVTHNDAVFLIDARGRERVLLHSEDLAKDLTGDLRALLKG